jgi:hypothetical protein
MAGIKMTPSVLARTRLGVPHFYLVAPTVSAGKEGFVPFDFKTKKWSPPLVKGMFQHWMTSIDGQYLYLMTGSDDPKILRVRLPSGTLDRWRV